MPPLPELLLHTQQVQFLQCTARAYTQLVGLAFATSACTTPCVTAQKSILRVDPPDNAFYDCLLFAGCACWQLACGDAITGSNTLHVALSHMHAYLKAMLQIFKVSHRRLLIQPPPPVVGTIMCYVYINTDCYCPTPQPGELSTLEFQLLRLIRTQHHRHDRT